LRARTARRVRAELTFYFAAAMAVSLVQRQRPATSALGQHLLWGLAKAAHPPACASRQEMAWASVVDTSRTQSWFGPQRQLPLPRTGLRACWAQPTSSARRAKSFKVPRM